MSNNSVRAANRMSNRSANRTPNVTPPGGSAIRTGGLSWISYVILLLIAAFSVLLLVFLIQYLRGTCGPAGRVGFWDYLYGMDAEASPCIPAAPEVEYEEREERHENEPYLINDQIYNFKEARKKCQAYGATLATRNQLVQAYNNGLHAPMYGWGQGKNAWQVVQPCEYVKMRREGIDVAPPGVQGGKFNKHFRVGAWCYGVKPPGEVAVPKSYKCPYPEVCQRNPDACVPLKSDNISPFFPGKKWSEFD